MAERVDPEPFAIGCQQDDVHLSAVVHVDARHHRWVA